MLGTIWLLLVTPIARVVGTTLSAQTQYHHLDGGRPVRVEGADPTARYALDVDVAPFQLERLSGGTIRYRAEPKVTYGALPFTEFELRVPLVQVNPPRASGTLSTSGIAGVSLGAKHAFNVETTRFPAFAIDAELSLPVGGLAAEKSSYVVKGLLSRTTALRPPPLECGCRDLCDPAREPTWGRLRFDTTACSRTRRYDVQRRSSDHRRCAMRSLPERERAPCHRVRQSMHGNFPRVVDDDGRHRRRPRCVPAAGAGSAAQRSIIHFPSTQLCSSPTCSLSGSSASFQRSI